MQGSEPTTPSLTRGIARFRGRAELKYAAMALLFIALGIAVLRVFHSGGSAKLILAGFFAAMSCLQTWGFVSMRRFGSAIDAEITRLLQPVWSADSKADVLLANPRLKTHSTLRPQAYLVMLLPVLLVVILLVDGLRAPLPLLVAMLGAVLAGVYIRDENAFRIEGRRLVREPRVFRFFARDIDLDRIRAFSVPNRSVTGRYYAGMSWLELYDDELRSQLRLCREFCDVETMESWARENLLDVSALGELTTLRGLMSFR